MNQVSRPQPFPAPTLGRRGLIVTTFVMILCPFAIVAFSVWYFPEVDDRPLPVTVSLDGYATPAQVMDSIQAAQLDGGSPLEPYLTITNDGADVLTSIFVTVNKRFVFHSGEPLEPGASRDFYLHRFLEPDGSRFWPQRYDIRRVVVKARLPSRKQGVYQADWATLTASSDRAATRPAEAEGASSEAGAG